MYSSSNHNLFFKHYITLAVSLLILIGGIALLPMFASSQKPELVIRLGSFSRGISLAPYFVAQQQHLFDTALKPFNARIDYQEFHTLPSINEAFASGKLDAVMEADAPCLIGKAAGIN